MELVPVTTYRVPSASNEVLVSNNFMFVVDTSGSSLYVLSCKTAEARVDSLNEVSQAFSSEVPIQQTKYLKKNVFFVQAMGPEALVDKFELKSGETFLAFYLFPSSHEADSNVHNANGSRNKSNGNVRMRIPKPRHNSLRGVLQPSVEEELRTVKGFSVPSCLVVTNKNVYLLLLRCGKLVFFIFFLFNYF